jgi:hypothetical protein
MFDPYLMMLVHPQRDVLSLFNDAGSTADIIAL